jgi:ribosomal protein L21E
MKNKSIRDHGKIRLSKYFQELKEGDKVAITLELDRPSNVPKRMQGGTGTIESRRGKAYVVRLNDNNQVKRYIVEAMHLKRVK